jgi:hypothetical protein
MRLTPQEMNSLELQFGASKNPDFFTAGCNNLNGYFANLKNDGARNYNTTIARY